MLVFRVEGHIPSGRGRKEIKVHQVLVPLGLGVHQRVRLPEGELVQVKFIIVRSVVNEQQVAVVEQNGLVDVLLGLDPVDEVCEGLVVDHDLGV